MRVKITKKETLEKMIEEKKYLENLDLKNLHLSHMEFEGVTFEDVDFSKASIYNCYFVDCEFISCKFEKTTIYHSLFCRVEFDLMENFSFDMAELEEVLFLKSVLNELDFYSAKCGRTYFVETDLNDVSFEKATLNRLFFKYSKAKVRFHKTVIDSFTFKDSSFIASYRDRVDYCILKNGIIKNCELNFKHFKSCVLEDVEFIDNKGNVEFINCVQFTS